MAITAAEYSAVYSINSDQQTALEATHGEGHLAHVAINPESSPFIAGVLKEVKDLQTEIDYLRTEISANKDNKTVIGSSTTVSFGDMITTVTGKGPKAVTTYTIIMTVVNGGVTKTTTLTLT
jgi:hypothetical protein